MNDIEAFLLFLAYILHLGGIGNVIYGATENDKSKIILGMACVLTALFIMGYLLYFSKKKSDYLLMAKRQI